MRRETVNRALGRSLLVILALLTGAGELAAREIRPKVRLAPNPVGMQERVVLSISLEGASLQGRTPQITFDLNKLRLLAGPSRSMEFQIVNGVPTTSQTLSWTLEPTEIGEAGIQNLLVQIDGQEIELSDQRVEVVAEMPRSRLRRQRPPDPFDALFGGSDPFEDLFGRQRPRRPTREPQKPTIFLRAEVDDRQPWVGQQVLYTLYLYTNISILSVQPDGLPNFKGMWAQEIPQPEAFEKERVIEDGVQLTRVVLLQRALFPRREGQVELEPVVARMVARGGMGLLARSEDVVRESNGLNLEVRALPEAPAGFRGAVGRLNLKAELNPVVLEVGEASTLTLRLDGLGHLQGIEAPTLPELPGLKQFAPQQESSESLRGTRVRGQRVWSFVLVPERPGEIELPPVELTYFDPREGAYRTARAELPALEVQGSARLPTIEGQAMDLHSIRNAALPTVRGESGGRRGGGLLLFSLPWLATVGLLLLRLRGGSGEHAEARRGLLQALQAAESEDSARPAAAGLEQAWRDYLHQRWQVPLGTASPQWPAQLEARGVAASTAAELSAMADDLHYLRYAPKLSSTEELKSELIERSRRLLRSLR